MADDEGKMSRRLSAVLLADMKDYSALMGENEARAIAGVDDIGAVFARVVAQHGGTFEVTGGDRFFAVFESAVEAFEAALEIQRALAAAGAWRSAAARDPHRHAPRRGSPHLLRLGGRQHQRRRTARGR